MSQDEIAILCGCIFWIIAFVYYALIRPQRVLRRGCKCGGRWIRDNTITEAEMDDSHYFCNKCNKKISLPFQS